MQNWDTSLVEDMSMDTNYGGFSGYQQWASFNVDISRWNTEKVTDMSYMFYGASAFNQDIGRWNTEKVTAMNGMFNSASAFNQDISSWTGTAATTAQTDMFDGATAFQDKFLCNNTVTGPASSCDTIKISWVASSGITLNGLLGLISASVVAFALL